MKQKMRLGLVIWMLCALLAGGASAEDIQWEDASYSEVVEQFGLAYQGEWTCFDDAFSLYLPVELEPVAPVNAENAIAEYTGVSARGARFGIQVLKLSDDDTLQALKDEEERAGGESSWVRFNGVPLLLVLDAPSIRMTLIVAGKGCYTVALCFPGNEEEDMEGLAELTICLLSSVNGNLTAQDEGPAREESPTQEDAKNTVELRFEFASGSEEDWDYINEKLAAIPASFVSIEDERGYLCTTEYPNEPGKEPTRRYGFEKLTLVCEQDESMEWGIFQLSQEILPADEAIEARSYWDMWREAHPERMLRSLHVMNFDDWVVYITVHEGAQ